MSPDEMALLSALRDREGGEYLLRKLDALQDSDSVPDDARRQLRQEYVDRILAAEHETARIKDELSAGLPSAQGEPARRLRAIIDAESAAELEGILAVRRPERKPSAAGVRPSSSPVAHPGHGLRRLATGLACAGIAVFAILRWGLPAAETLRPTQPGGPEDLAVTVSLVTGDRVDVGAGQIDTAGGALVAGGTNGLLDGLALDVPPKAYPEPVTFSLSYEPVEDFDAPEGVEVLSPLIHLDASTAAYADQLIAVTVPVDVPEGHFASLFVYDEETRVLKGLPTLEESDGTLTMLGTHFCPIVALSAPYERLAAPAGKASVDLDSLKVTSGFRPERDMWNLVNAGSVVAPGGYCRGMSLSSLYYYMVEGGIQETPLFESEYGNGLPEGTGTPGFWQDDRFAIQLCSIASNLGTTKEAGTVEDAMSARIDRLSPDRKATNQQRQFYLTALALYVTGAPQLLGVHSSAGGGGHSLLCFGVNGHTLSIADPNYPGKPDITMAFKDGRLGPYRSAQNAKDVASGKYVDYDRVYYEGDISFFNLARLQGYWVDYEAGGLDRHFPSRTIKVTELDSRGAEQDTYVLDTLSGIQTDAAQLRFDLEAGGEARLTLYRYGNPPSAMTGNLVTPERGNSLLGFLIEQKTAFGWEWSDFNWVRVSASAIQPEPAPASRQLDFNECFLHVEFDAATRNVATGELAEPSGRTLGGSYRGTFNGNTFKATWSEEYEPGSRYHTVNHGSLTVTVDPAKPEVVSFFWEDQWNYTCGGLLRHAVDGSSIQLDGWDSNNAAARFAGGFSGQQPVKPEVTWIERPPAAGPDCGPGPTCLELLSIENYRVTIIFAHR